MPPPSGSPRPAWWPTTFASWIGNRSEPKTRRQPRHLPRSRPRCVSLRPVGRALWKERGGENSMTWKMWGANAFEILTGFAECFRYVFDGMTCHEWCLMVFLMTLELDEVFRSAGMIRTVEEPTASPRYNDEFFVESTSSIAMLNYQGGIVSTLYSWSVFLRHLQFINLCRHCNQHLRAVAGPVAPVPGWDPARLRLCPTWDRPGASRKAPWSIQGWEDSPKATRIVPKHGYHRVN